MDLKLSDKIAVALMGLVIFIACCVSIQWLDSMNERMKSTEPAIAECSQARQSIATRLDALEQRIKALEADRVAVDELRFEWDTLRGSISSWAVPMQQYFDMVQKEYMEKVR
jgi:septal ring factor EnvC (AmiA/AmiB activator)